MPRLAFKPAADFVDGFRYEDDVQRIVDVCQKHGFEISENDAKLCWEQHSDSYCASWLILPESDVELFEAIKENCRVTI